MYSKCLELSDYDHLKEELIQLRKVEKLLGNNRIAESQHRDWEYCRGLQLIKQMKPRAVLDVGGGGSTFCQLVARNCKGTTVNIIDIRDCRSMVFWQNYTLGTWIGYFLQDFLTAPLASYDFVSCISVLEHIDQDEFFLMKLMDTVDDNGILYLTMDYHESGLQLCQDHKRTYNKQTLLNIIKIAEIKGFSVYNGYNYDSEEKNVRDYNFASLTLIKKKYG